jgi:hypothetical protein
MNYDYPATPEQEPAPGLTTEVEIVRVIDADTYVVRLTREFPVRLTDEVLSSGNVIFDSPEKNTMLGQLAKKYCVDNFLGKTVRLFIPSGDPTKLTDINSFNRIIGAIWIRGKRITEILRDQGFGRFILRKDRKKTSWTHDSH